VTATNDDGELVKLTPGANYLNAIRQFLKDNGVEAQADQPGASFNKFAAMALPFLDTEDGTAQPGH
jgi:hypothetical protein